jgi:hypothetical protein
MPVKNLLNQTITYKNRTGQDKYNKPTYGTAVSLSAREEVTTQILEKNGSQEISQITIVYVENDGSTIPKAEDQITLTDGTVETVLAVKPELGRFGTINHYKVWIGRTRLKA